MEWNERNRVVSDTQGKNPAIFFSYLLLRVKKQYLEYDNISNITTDLRMEAEDVLLQEPSTSNA